MTDEVQPLPNPGDEVWDDIEATEAGDIPEDGPVVIRQSELEELEEFLKAVQQLLLAHEERLSNLEAAVGAMLEEAQEFEKAIREAYGEGGSQEVEGGGAETTIVDGSGQPLDSRGSEVPGDDS